MKSRKKTNDPTQEELWEYFSYDPETGNLTVNHTGHVCGSRKNKERVNKVWYLNACYKGQTHGAHRIIWIMVHGQIPEGMTIDHINLDRRDNRISNLRLATVSNNLCNKHAYSATGYKGVYPARKKFKAEIRKNNRTLYLGIFDTEVEAALAYEEAAKRYHGQFARVTSSASAA